jgi:hypothetical protein
MAGAAAVASPDTDPQGPQGPQANLCLASKSRNLTPPHTVQREIPTSSHRLNASSRNHACSKEMRAGACNSS